MAGRGFGHRRDPALGLFPRHFANFIITRGKQLKR
jgi:hypothetical protein